MSTSFMRLINFGLLAICTTFAPTSMAQDRNVKVMVTRLVIGGKSAYRYRVINGTSQRIVALSIGYDYPHGTYNLTHAPLGWVKETGIPEGSVSVPYLWRASYITTEESAVENTLEWRSSVPLEDILPGEARSGFTVITGNPANDFHSGVWTVIFGGPSPTSANLALSGALVDDPNPDLDTTPPTLSVAASPSTIWPPNHKLVRVVLDVQAKDDRDPSPVVRLLSVTCNEPIAEGDISPVALGTDVREVFVKAERKGTQKQGRTYTFKYSATDASGNETIATATTAIPHDKGK